MGVTLNIADDIQIADENLREDEFSQSESWREDRKKTRLGLRVICRIR